MPKKVWTLTLEDGPHTVELDHNTLSGRKHLRIDDAPPQPLIQPGKSASSIDGDYPFSVGGHAGTVLIRYRGFGYTYDLAIDGLSLQTGLRPLPAGPLPVWGWIFIILCGLLLTGGALGGGLGAAGALVCYGLARDLSRPTLMRVAACLGVTLACWILYAVAAAGFNILLHAARSQAA